MNVELFKKKTTYKDATSGEEKTGIRFYIKCNDTLIPIEVSYFGKDAIKEDKQYKFRKTIVSTFATELPEKESK